MSKNKIALFALFTIIHWGNIFCSEKFVLCNYPLTQQTGYWTNKADLAYGDHSKTSYIVIDFKSQREDWYQITPYIAEFECTLTSLPFLLVAHIAYKAQKPVAAATIASAGIGSALSHAIPRQWVHHVDTLTALSAIGGIVYDCKLTDLVALKKAMSNPSLLIPTLATAAMYGIDVGFAHSELTQPYRKKWQTKIHSLWHFVAAYVLLAFVLYGIQN